MKAFVEVYLEDSDNIDTRNVAQVTIEGTTEDVLYLIKLMKKEFGSDNVK